MLNKYILLVLSIMFVCCSNLFAVDIKLQVDTSNISMEESLELKIVVSGVRNVQGNPQIVGLEKWQVESQSSSSSIRIVNGNMSVEKVYSYSLYPKKDGSYILGPAKIEINGNKYSSKTKVVKVSKTTTKNGINTNQEDKGYYVEQSLSKQNVYVGEQVVYTFRLVSKKQISDTQLFLPNFDKFWKEELGNTKTYTRVVKGERYSISEIRLALFPLNSGIITIENAVLNGKVAFRPSNSRRRNRGSVFNESFLGSFFDNQYSLKKVRVKSKEINLKVLDLPESENNNDFKGLIGQFYVQASLSKNIMKVGESATLTLRVQGKGNINKFSFPDFDIPSFKTYKDRPQIKISKSEGGLSGYKEIKIALVPQEEGVKAIGPFEFVYFNPKIKSYETMSTKTFNIQVDKSEGDDNNINLVTGNLQHSKNKKNIKVLGQDLMPLKRNVFNLGNDIVTFRNKIIIILMIIFMPMIFLIARVFRARRDKFLSNDVLRKKSKAYQKFSKNYSKINKDVPLELSAILREFIGDKIGLDGLSLTPVEAFERLQSKGVADKLSVSVKNILKDCEAMLYGGGDGVVDGKDIRKKIKVLAKKLDRELR